MSRRAAAKGEHGLRSVDKLADDAALQLAERGLAVIGEELPDRASGPLLDDMVAVDERQPEALGEQVPHGRFTRPHEADENDHGAVSPGSGSSSGPGERGGSASAASSAIACSASW
jgi:hypothetical protein